MGKWGTFLNHYGELASDWYCCESSCKFNLPIFDHVWLFQLYDLSVFWDKVKAEWISRCAHVHPSTLNKFLQATLDKWWWVQDKLLHLSVALQGQVSCGASRVSHFGRWQKWNLAQIVTDSHRCRSQSEIVWTLPVDTSRLLSVTPTDFISHDWVDADTPNSAPTALLNSGFGWEPAFQEIRKPKCIIHVACWGQSEPRHHLSARHFQPMYWCKSGWLLRAASRCANSAGRDLAGGTVVCWVKSMNPSWLDLRASK